MFNLNERCGHSRKVTSCDTAHQYKALSPNQVTNTRISNPFSPYASPRELLKVKETNEQVVTSLGSVEGVQQAFRKCLPALHLCG